MKNQKQKQFSYVGIVIKCYKNIEQLIVQIVRHLLGSFFDGQCANFSLNFKIYWNYDVPEIIFRVGINIFILVSAIVVVVIIIVIIIMIGLVT